MAEIDKTTAAAAPAASGGARPIETGEQKARRWMDENLAGGPIARNTEMWNAVMAALPALGKIIDG